MYICYSQRDLHMSLVAYISNQKKKDCGLKQISYGCCFMYTVIIYSWYMLLGWVNIFLPTKYQNLYLYVYKTPITGWICQTCCKGHRTTSGIVSHAPNCCLNLWVVIDTFALQKPKAARCCCKYTHLNCVRRQPTQITASYLIYIYSIRAHETESLRSFVFSAVCHVHNEYICWL